MPTVCPMPGKTSNGLDPADGIGGGYRDLDRDGLSDLEEYQQGFSACVPLKNDGGLPGGLQVELWYGIGGSSIASLVSAPHFGDAPDACVIIDRMEYVDGNVDAAENYGARIRGTITRSGRRNLYIFTDR